MPIDLYRNPLSNTIFVFGSNLAGRHGAGAAKFAAQFYGAEYGIGEGITGKAYALPTKDANIKTLAFEDVQWHCQQFLDYARRTRDSLFQLTRVGCGLAGLRDEDMAPLFKTAPENVLLPGHWVLLNKQLGHARLVVAGGMMLIRQCCCNALSTTPRIGADALKSLRWKKVKLRRLPRSGR